MKAIPTALLVGVMLCLLASCSLFGQKKEVAVAVNNDVPPATPAQQTDSGHMAVKVPMAEASPAVPAAPLTDVPSSEGRLPGDVRGSLRTPALPNVLPLTHDGKVNNEGN